MKVYLDTSAIYALISKSDRYHGEAASTYKMLLDSNLELWINSFVLEEVVNLIWYRMGKGLAITTARWLLDEMNVRWLGEDEVREVLDEAAEAPAENRLSLVDWSLVRLASQENAQVFTFDEKIRSASIRVLP
jgi:predicted nucleic acid-binding protein